MTTAERTPGQIILTALDATEAHRQGVDQFTQQLADERQAQTQGGSDGASGEGM